jgi:hypothetical protein
MDDLILGTQENGSWSWFKDELDYVAVVMRRVCLVAFFAFAPKPLTSDRGAGDRSGRAGIGHVRRARLTISGVNGGRRLILVRGKRLALQCPVRERTGAADNGP